MNVKVGDLLYTAAGELAIVKQANVKYSKIDTAHVIEWITGSPVTERVDHRTVEVWRYFYIAKFGADHESQSR